MLSEMLPPDAAPQFASEKAAGRVGHGGSGKSRFGQSSDEAFGNALEHGRRAGGHESPGALDVRPARCRLRTVDAAAASVLGEP